MFSDDKLIHYYQWYQSNYGRDEICDIIHQHFERTGRLFSGKVPSQLAITPANIGSILTGPPQTFPNYNQVAPPYYPSSAVTPYGQSFTQPPSMTLDLAPMHNYVNYTPSSNDTVTLQEGSNGLQYL
jgi:hypothetical protein